METTLYLIRHAQSHPSPRRHQSEWPLSSAGRRQAEKLGNLLVPLGITKLFSSPFRRCLDTMRPFALHTGADVHVEDDLRERMIVQTYIDGFEKVWCKSWEDFDFALPGCESSTSAQRRFVDAITRIVRNNAKEVLGISTHGNVLGLLLNSIDGSVGKQETENLTNPDVVRMAWKEDSLVWDPEFHLPGLKNIVTDHRDTPVDR